MNLKILKKDLKYKKSMNLILLIFIFLATTLIAGSINNLIVGLNGTDYFMEKAGISDFIFVTQGGSPEDISDGDKKAEAFLKESETVTKYSIDDILYISKGNVETDKSEKYELNNTAIISSCKIAQQNFFDEENHLITDMDEGTIYLNRTSMRDNDLEPGDMLYIYTENGYRKGFEVKGYCKDAFLGSDMMGTSRYIISETDFQELLGNSGLTYGRLYSIECNDLEHFEQDYNDAGISVVFSGGKALIKTTFIMDIIIAAVLMAVSICLVLISVVMLRFTIIFTVNEDYKEIGIMKALGIKDKAIRRLYLSKYFAIAVLGAVLGFVASIPFSRGLLDKVMENIVADENASGIGLQFGVCVLIVGVVVLFAYLGTGKIKEFSPMDAIRSGNNGERFRKKGILKLGGSKMKPTTFLAGNDVLSEIRKYLVLLVTGIIGVWLVVMPVNTINTLRSENIRAWFALTDCDFYIIDEDKSVELTLSGDKQQYYDYLEEMKAGLQDDNIDVSKIVMEVVFRFKIRKGEASYNSLSSQGLNTTTDQYFNDEGTPPMYDNEIAITHVVAEKIHAEIGDTVYITNGEEEKPYVITAVYQSMNNMGEGIRFPEETELDYSASMGTFGAQVVLKEKPDEKQLAEIMQRVKKLMPEARVETVTEFIDGMIGGISDQLSPQKTFVLVMVIVINVLVVVLMQKMFLIREQGEMGMLKAIGFSDGNIISWQTKRIMLVLFVGILIGTLTRTSFSEITSGQVFKIMGASKITFEINPLEVYVLYPAVLFVGTIIACIVTMLKVRKISPQEMNQIE